MPDVVPAGTSESWYGIFAHLARETNSIFDVLSCTPATGKEADMLVLTRRENERIVFPEVGITVEVVSVSGSRARLGVDAPAEVRILRHEIAEKEGIEPVATFPLAQKPGLKSWKPSHELRNRLNTTTLAAQLLRRQIDQGMVDDAEDTVKTLLEELATLQKTALDPSQAVKEKQDTQHKQPAQVTPRALIVEDNQNEQKLLAGFLKMAGFEVVTANDGQQAIDYLLSNERPDVVLLDMLMPGCDGPTAVKEIRSHPELEDLKIFAVSGTAPSDLGVTTGPEGINRWFDKPINPEELAREMVRDLAS